ncbi:hypothetical protein MSKU15_1942 [Komagataeibacter diospyri]|nr:hypothetical protein MSKU15_1942 [Komagataeibacter diospyri]
MAASGIMRLLAATARLSFVLRKDDYALPLHRASRISPRRRIGSRHFLPQSHDGQIYGTRYRAMENHRGRLRGKTSTSSREASRQVSADSP